MKLFGDNLTLEECNPAELPPLPYEPFLDPHVGQVREPRYFLVCLKDKPIGVLGDCVIYNPQPDEIEFGIKIIPEFREMGYGSEATKIISDYCLTTAGYSRVHLKVLPYNDRAIRSYEKAGFRRCGKIVIDGVEFVKMEKTR